MVMKKLQESFLNRYSDDFLEYVERTKDTNVYTREDYIEIMKQIEKFGNEHSNVRTFLNGEKLVPLTDEEYKIAIKIKDLENDINFLVQKEVFKLGFREAYIFFKEMNLLKY